MHDTSYLVPAGEVSARRRGERARRRRQVRGAPDAGDAARAALPATAACTARPATTDCSCACSSTAARLGDTRILSETSVKTMLESQSGKGRRAAAAVGESVAVDGTSRSAPARTTGDSAFSWPRNRRPNRRSPGSGTWAGIFNTHFFIDPSARDRRRGDDADAALLRRGVDEGLCGRRRGGLPEFEVVSVRFPRAKGSRGQIAQTRAPSGARRRRRRGRRPHGTAKPRRRGDVEGRTRGDARRAPPIRHARGFAAGRVAHLRPQPE